MVNCPVCDGQIDVDEEDVDEGDSLSCDECGADLKVVGTESVTVPAGTFDAYKVELASADGGADKQTLWIAKDSRKPLKMTAVLASMGGATMTMELLP